MKSFFDFYEEAMAAPTNNVGGGNIAGTKPAGDDPPVRRKKKYIYGGRGSRLSLIHISEPTRPY